MQKIQEMPQPFIAEVHGIATAAGCQLVAACDLAGAEVVVVPCPMYQMNLDSRQVEIRKERGTVYSLPVLCFSQLTGLAYGYSPREVGLTRLLVSPISLLQEKQVL